MKQIKSFTTILLSGIFLALIMQSCMVTKTPVGQYQEQTGKEVVFDKGKQMYLFWGVVRLRTRHVPTPSSGDCLVITRTNFGDVLINVLTGGIICSQTIKIKVKQQEESK